MDLADPVPSSIVDTMYLHRILSGGKQLFTLSLPGAPFEESFQCQFESAPHWAAMRVAAQSVYTLVPEFKELPMADAGQSAGLEALCGKRS